MIKQKFRQDAKEAKKDKGEKMRGICQVVNVERILERKQGESKDLGLSVNSSTSVIKEIKKNWDQ